MANRTWPLFDVVIRTPALEVRYPDDELLVELADLTARGIHDPEAMLWESRARSDIEIDGLDACLEWFGVVAGDGAVHLS